ncbi:MAG TPA: hypothetical protein VM818_05365 [Vicinamibacterales bacterium]|nr:hypothetical protein [Vicinamibacterales bacterium]
MLNRIGWQARQLREHPRSTLLYFDKAGVLNDRSSHLSTPTAR